MKNFQIIILIVFIALAIFGLLVFSGAIPIGSNSQGSLGTVVLWGTVPAGSIAAPLQDFNNANKTLVVKYVQKSSDTFDQDLLEALATGNGPDIFFLPDNLTYHYANKIFTIPYTSYPLSSFKSIFAGAGEVFLTSDGILAFPMTIDPLMMYYNRSILDANGVVYPPVTWDDLVGMVPTLTHKDNSNKIIKPAVAFGHFANVSNAKDILATLFMQNGNSIITEQNGIFHSVLSDSVGNSNPTSVLKFYTDFANPSSATYSWNASFPNSVDVFSAENLAFYFGFASELQNLVNSNPNENFFVTSVPQIKNSSFKLTSARITGLAISSSSKNFTAAFTAASLLATGDFAAKYASITGTTPARRDLLIQKPADAYMPIFYNSALYAKSWLDPSPLDTNNIFSGMIDNVLSGSMTVDGAVKDASAKMGLLLNK
jgi:multiple sugar transport system substrate-binding protein